MAATTINVVAETITEWSDLRTDGIEVWITADGDWIDADAELHGAGSIENAICVKQIDNCTVDTNAYTLSIPAFTLTSTRDALMNNTVRLYATIVQVIGGAATRIRAVPGTEDGFVVPNFIGSGTGCSPSGTCCSWGELILYTRNSSVPPSPTYISYDEAVRLIAAGSVGAPAGAEYIVKTPNATLTNAQAMSDLATGIVKNTTATGVQSIAVGGTDYENPLTFSLPLSRSTNTISIPAASAGQNGYLSSADWTTFNNKQAALGFTPENSANKNAASGYAGLSGGKVAQSQISEVMGLEHLTDVTGASGTGTTVPKGTFTSLTLNDVLTWNGSNWINQAAAATGVTSVAMTVPSVFSVAGSPITSTGTLAVTFATGQTQNQVLASPDGSSGAVGLRALVNADMPTVLATKGGSGLTSHVAYALFAGSTTTTGNYQQVSGVGTSGQVLTSNGAGALPTWQAAAALATHALLSSTHNDTTPATVVRGDIITGQGSAPPTWGRLAVGAANRYVGTSNGVDVGYVQVSLSAGVTGTLPVANGGTGAASYTDGQLLIGNSATGGLTVATLTAGSANISIVNDNGSITIDAVGTPGSAWDTLTSPSGAATLSMSTNTTTWTWAGNTSSTDLFTFRDTTGNTGTGYLLLVHSRGTSTLKPFGVFVGGTTNGVGMNASGVFSAIGTGTIVATSGDSATAFFGAGEIEAARGGTGIDTSGSTGVPRIAAGTWSADAGISHLASSTSAQLAAVISDETGSGALVFATSPTLVTPTLGVASATSIAIGGGSALTTSNQSGTDDLVLTTSPTLTTPTINNPVISVLTVTTTARTSGVAPYALITAPADTGQTASTEAIGVQFATVAAAGSRTHATGALATQRDYVFEAIKHAFSGTSTITDAATVAITAAPIAGSNATITNAYALWVQSGKSFFADAVNFGTQSTNFWIDSHPNADIHRLNDRLFIGGATTNDGKTSNTTSDWAETLVDGITSNSQFAVLNTIGLIGVLGASRSSDFTSAPTAGTIGLLGFVSNDNVTHADSAYAGYFEAWDALGSASAATHGVEIDVVNKRNNAIDINPYSMSTTGLTNALWLASGGSRSSVFNASVGLAFVNNGANFRKGIVFGATSIGGADGTEGGTGIAIEMALDHQLVWLDSGGNQRGILGANYLQLYSTTTFFPQVNVQAVNDTAASFMLFDRARAGTTAVQNGDNLGSFAARGFSNSAYNNAVNFTFVVDGTVSGSNVPAGITFTTNNGSAFAERMRLSAVGNLKIGGTAVRGTTEGTAHIDLFNGTAPAGTLTNGVSLYSASGELRAMDAAGNSTPLSSHDHKTNEWIYYSINTVTGKALRVDMERMMRFLNDHFGTDFVRDYTSEADARPDLFN